MKRTHTRYPYDQMPEVGNTAVIRTTQPLGHVKSALWMHSKKSGKKYVVVEQYDMDDEGRYGYKLARDA